MRAAKVTRKRAKSPPRVVYRKGSWLRDRELLGAWAFRGVLFGLGSLILWNVTGYTKKIDELALTVPILSNTVSALTEQLKSEQGQISKLWDHVFDAATSNGRKK